MEPQGSLGRLAPGRVLAGRYVVAELIGRGGMAEVYRGRDQRLARQVALKVLRAEFAYDPRLRLRFEEEAKAAALVSHPNVVGVYDAGEDSEAATGDSGGHEHHAFIVMELVVGEPLANRIARGPLESADVRRIGAQILDALSAAHARGVLHRDIKPANVLLTDDGTAKVADFGIAKAVHPSPDNENATAMNIVLGTPGYLAPERAQGNPATVRSDLWSVGVVLYEAMTGVRPFVGDNPIAVTLAAQEGRYVPLLERRPDADRAVAAIVQRALDPDPDNRFASAAEMGRALILPDIRTVPLSRPLISTTPTDTVVVGSDEAGGTGATGATGAGPAGVGAAAAAGAAGMEAAYLAGEAGTDPTTIASAAYLAGAGGVAGVGGVGGATPVAGTTAGGSTGPSPGTLPGGGTVDLPYSPTKKPRRRGTAVVVAAAIVALIAGAAVILALSGSHSPTVPKHDATTTTRAKSTTTTTKPRSATTTSSSLASTTSSSTTTPTSTTTTTAPTSTTTTTTAPTSTTTTTTTTSTTSTTTTTTDPTTTSTTTTTSPGGGATTTTDPTTPSGS